MNRKKKKLKHTLDQTLPGKGGKKTWKGSSELPKVTYLIQERSETVSKQGDTDRDKIKGGKRSRKTMLA